MMILGKPKKGFAVAIRPQNYKDAQSQSIEAQRAEGDLTEEYYNTASRATWQAFKDAVASDDYEAGMKAMKTMYSMFANGDFANDYDED